MDRSPTYSHALQTELFLPPILRARLAAAVTFPTLASAPPLLEAIELAQAYADLPYFAHAL